jgi:hypothetical protein
MYFGILVVSRRSGALRCGTDGIGLSSVVVRQRSIGTGFGFGLAGEGEDIRGRFLADAPSEASDPFVGVDGGPANSEIHKHSHSLLLEIKRHKVGRVQKQA